MLSNMDFSSFSLQNKKDLEYRTWIIVIKVLRIFKATQSYSATGTESKGIAFGSASPGDDASGTTSSANEKGKKQQPINNLAWNDIYETFNN